MSAIENETGGEVDAVDHGHVERIRPPIPASAPDERGSAESSDDEDGREKE